MVHSCDSDEEVEVADEVEEAKGEVNKVEEDEVVADTDSPNQSMWTCVDTYVVLV